MRVQTPRLVHRRPRQNLAMVLVMLTLAILCIIVPSLLKTGNITSVINSRENGVQLSSKSAEFDSSDLEEPEKKSAEEAEFEKSAVQEDNSVNFLDPKLEDPMSSFLVGYPSKPLTLEELKLCAKDETIILKGTYHCDEDPSCLKCVDPKQIDRYRDLIAAYRNPEIEKARKEQISKDFAGQHTVVLFTFNFAHSDLFLNWACSAHKLGLDVRKFTLVVPCDEKTTALVKDLGFKYVDPSWQKLLKKPIKSKESYWGQDHADINNLALFTMLDIVEQGFHVFVHDADVAWIRDPFPFFKNAIRRRDFMGMLAPFWNSMGPVNTGLLYLAPTEQLKIFLKSMENAAVIKGTSDQRLWNSILRHFVFQQLEWRLLPQVIVYKYSGRHAPPPDDRALLMHALGSNKREKLGRYKLWLLEETCPFYNAESAALSDKERKGKEPNPT